MATRRSTWARCSITERTPLVQVKLIFHIMELLDFEILSMVKFPHLQGQTMTFLGLRSSMQGHGDIIFGLTCRNEFQFNKKFYWEIKDIHRPADIYGGNGASWEAVPSLEKLLVRVREKPIYERFCLSNDFTFQYMTTFSNWSQFSHKIDTVEADWVMERLEELAPAAILGEQPFFMGWGLHRW